MGGGTVYQGVVLTPGPPSCDKGQSFQVDDIPGKGSDDNQVPRGGSGFRQIRGVQPEPLHNFAVFPVFHLQVLSITKRRTWKWRVLSSVTIIFLLLLPQPSVCCLRPPATNLPSGPQGPVLQSLLEQGGPADAHRHPL